MRKSTVIMFIVSYFVWCLLSWVPDWQHLIAGVFVAFLVTVLTSDLFGKTPVLRNPVRCVYFVFVYVPKFLWEVLKANIDVAYRVIHPAVPINPGIVKVKTSLRSDVALTFLANSITLTPGTMTVDIDKDNGVLYIHWINVKDKEVEGATKMIVEKFENILKKIFE